MFLPSFFAAAKQPVDMDELNQLMRMLNMPVVSGQMEKMMAEVSSTGDGEITMEDFLHVMKAKEKNPHTKHLLLADFELFRPANCPKGYIPREQLVNVLLKQSRTEGEMTKQQNTEGLGNSNDGKKNTNSTNGVDTSTNNDVNNTTNADQNEVNQGGTTSGSSSSSSSSTTTTSTQQNSTTNSMTKEQQMLKEQQEQNDERQEGKWTESDIRDLIHNIPSNCFHKERSNLIHYEKLIQVMLGTIDDDPFQDKE
jgi:Ca2+-binding EF-hand superfamily protein